MNKPHVEAKQTYPINTSEIELIHRVFGGTKIICKSVATIDTGGGVMNDLYGTKCGKLIVVAEYHAFLYKNISDYYDGADYIATFEWNMPLYSIQELAEM